MRRFPDYINHRDIRNLQTAFYDMDNNYIGVLGGINWKPSSTGIEGCITFQSLFAPLDNTKKYFMHLEYDSDEGHKMFWIENIEVEDNGIGSVAYIRFMERDMGGVRIGRR